MTLTMWPIGGGPSTPMPSPSLMVLRLPSAATRYRERTSVRPWPDSTTVSTPPGVVRVSVMAVANRTCATGCSSACLRRITSSRSWEHRQV